MHYLLASIRYSGKKIRIGGRFFTLVQSDPGVHPASCTVSTVSFPGVKRPGRGADHPSPSSTVVTREYNCTTTHFPPSLLAFESATRYRFDNTVFKLKLSFHIYESSTIRFFFTNSILKYVLCKSCLLNLQICYSCVYCNLKALPPLWAQYIFTLLEDNWRKASTPHYARCVSMWGHQGRFALHVTESTDYRSLLRSILLCRTVL
jgi:hypothetical protein